MAQKSQEAYQTHKTLQELTRNARDTVCVEIEEIAWRKFFILFCFHGAS